MASILSRPQCVNDGFGWCTTYLALGLQELPNSPAKRTSRPKYFTHHANPPFKPITKIFNGHVLWGSVRNYFSVRTILNSTDCCEWLWYESSSHGLPCSEIGKWVTWHTKLRPKRTRVCDLCPLHPSFILQSPTNFVWFSDKYATIRIVLTMATVTLQVTARCQRWARLESWWQPMKFRNDMIVIGTKIVLGLVKLIGNKNEWWASYYIVLYKLNLMSNLSRISDSSVYSGS